MQRSPCLLSPGSTHGIHCDRYPAMSPCLFGVRVSALRAARRGPCACRSALRARRAPSLCIENPMICNKMIVLDVRRDVASSPRPGSRLARAQRPERRAGRPLPRAARGRERGGPARSRRRSGARGPHDPQCGPISDLRPAAGRARAGGRVVDGSPRRPRLRYSNTPKSTHRNRHTEAARDATRTAPSTAPTERCETPPPTSVLLASAPHGFGCTNAGSQ